MLGPNHHTHHVASQQYEERLTHAARIRMVQKDRTDDAKPFHRDAYRLITARRLAVGLAGVVLTVALAAGTVGTVAAAPGNASGGSMTLHR
jgi:hypothetical protein